MVSRFAASGAVGEFAVAVLSAAALAGLGVSGAPSLVVLAATALAGIVAALAPRSLIGATIVTLPYFYHPLAIGSQRVAASELLLFATVVGVGGRAALAAATRPRQVIMSAREIARDLPRAQLLLALTGLALLGVAYVVWPFNPDYRADTLREWRWTLFEPLILFASIWALGRRDDPTGLRRLLGACFVAGACVAALHGLSDLALGRGVDVEGVRRVGGPYPHPNALALYLERGAIFAAVWTALATCGRWLTGSAAVVCLAALASTFSRGALAAVALVLLALVWTHAPRLRLPAVALAALAAALAVAFASGRMLDLFRGGSGALRLDIWRSTLAMIRDRPVWGYGPDQFLYAYSPRYIEPTAWSERFTSHPHDMLLDFWVRLGIIGVASALVLAYWCVKRAINALGEAGAVSPLAAAGALALLAALLHGLVDNAYFQHDLAMSWWLLVWFALPASVPREKEGSAALEGAGSRRGRLHRLASV